MTMPTNQCPWRMQVHHITQETPDVWTISLMCHDYYPYRAGQYALVSVRNSAETLRAYTISSTPGVSEYITLTVRRIDDGVGSQWLTRDVKRGDYLWLSDAMGEFTCDDKAEDKFLLLAAGCGVTPIMSMRRWLAKNRPQADVRVIYNVRTPQDVIFADEWRNYPVTLVAENNVTEGFIAGRLTRELLAGVPDLTSRTVMTCGLEALESNNVPVVAACRAGVCGCCKTKVVSGEYTVSSTMTLTDAEIAEGYVLACSCHPQGDLVLA